MNIAKILYAAFIGSLAIVMMGSLCAGKPKDDVISLSQNLQKIITLKQKAQSQYSSKCAMAQEYDYLVYSYYKELYKKHAHYTLKQWQEALNIATATSADWRIKTKVDTEFNHPMDRFIADFFIWLNDQVTILSNLHSENTPFSHFILVEKSKNYKGRYFAAPKETSPFSIGQDIFEIETDKITVQKPILEALYKMLTYDVDYEGINDYYKQYRHALQSGGHYSIKEWWQALHTRTQQEGKTIVDLSAGSFYVGANEELAIIRYVLGIAMQQGNHSMSYREFLDTLESFYSPNDLHRNSKINIMIQERDHLRSLV